MSEPLVAPYENATEMRDHWWWRPGWRPGRHFYSIFATFEDQPELHHLVDEWQQRLAAVPGLDMVPREWRHLTIQGVGFTDELTSGQLDDITTEIEYHLSQTPAPHVRFGPLAIHKEALVLPALPPRPLRLVRDAIRVAITAVLDEGRVDGPADEYKPHVTVAYNSVDRSVPAEVLFAASAPIERADVTVRTVQLLRLDRDDRMYQWQPKQILALASA